MREEVALKINLPESRVQVKENISGGKQAQSTYQQKKSIF
jgi:hypothetical protein